MTVFRGVYILYAMLALMNISLDAKAAETTEITGAGATFPYPVYAKWAEYYEKATGNRVNYQPIGSGAGIKQITSNTVDFGASDKPLEQKDLKKYNLFQFPALMGGVVICYNLKGIETNTIKLTGEVLADIYLGKIKQWNDPALSQLNPDITLPNQPITVIHRSDGSGTTFIFTTYLVQMSKEWKEKVGVEVSVAWPVGIGGKGNAAIADFIKEIPGSIGYIEYAYVKESPIPTMQMKNHDGEWVTPNLATFKAAAFHADWEQVDNFYLILTNQPGKASWPITGATFILVHKIAKDPQATRAAIEFYNWSFKHGDALAMKLDYVSLPENLKNLIRKAWQDTLKDEQGKSLCMGEAKRNVCE